VLDTDRTATRRYYELLRSKSGPERLAIAAMLTASARRLAEAGIKSSRPDLTERQLQAELARRMYGAQVAERLFGADFRP
jgi:hypothetical protein